MSLIYTIIVALILVSSIFEMYSNKGANKIWFGFIITIMALTAGLAYGISPDWFAYWTTYEMTEDYSFGKLKELAEYMDMEMGYVWMNKLLNVLGLGYGAFTLLLASLALYLKSKTIFNYSGYVFLALLMYTIPTYFFEEHVHVRQGMANAIAIFSFQYIVKRDLKRFLLCIVFAFLFHKSVIVFIMAYWIVKIRFSSITIFLIVAAAVGANLLGMDRMIDGIMQFMPFGVGESYNDYVNETWEGGMLGDIVKVITVSVVLLLNKTVSKKDELFNYFRNLYILGVVLYFFFGKGIFASRLPGFYTVYIIFVVPRMIMALRDNAVVKNIVYLGFTLYTLLLYINFYNNWGDKSGFGNYKTFLNQRAVYGLFKND